MTTGFTLLALLALLALIGFIIDRDTTRRADRLAVAHREKVAAFVASEGRKIAAREAATNARRIAHYRNQAAELSRSVEQRMTAYRATLERRPNDTFAASALATAERRLATLSRVMNEELSPIECATLLLQF